MSTSDQRGMIATVATRIKPQSRGAILDNRFMLGAEYEGCAVGVGFIRYYGAWWAAAT